MSSSEKIQKLILSAYKKLTQMSEFFVFLHRITYVMNKNINNPLGLEEKRYTVEEFAFEIRNKFGNDDSVSDIFLAEIFLAKYPMYSCKIKKSQNQVIKGSCSCC